MILKRFTEALRKQDWATISIEFLIVVVGIFVGLQANEWAQARQDRADERAALERLFAEMENTNRDLGNFIARGKQLNELRRKAVQFVDSEDAVPENELPLKIGINTLAQFPPVLPVSVVYDELKSSGQLRLIQNAGVRVGLAEFHTGLEWLNKIRDGFREGTDPFWASYQRNITWAYNPDATTSDILISTYDWDRLRADDEFKFAAIGLLRNQLVTELGLVDLQKLAEASCQNLAEEIGKSCNLSEASQNKGGNQ